jgi:type IV secretion system protein VirD4
MNQAASANWRPAPKVAWGRRLAIGVGGMLLGLIASQWLAGYILLWSFHLRPQAATPLTIARYAHFYGGNPFVRKRLILDSLLAFGLVATIVTLVMWPKARSLHGDARFATRPEIRAAGLFSDHGFLLGRLGRRYLILPGQQSVILAAPPRSGKDVGIVIPNALHWSGSLVITDIKREVWTLTAGFRASQGQACHLLDMLSEDGRTAHWNCLSYVSQHPDRRINDIQRIADILYQESPGADPFWTASARSLFTGIALYLFETPSLPKTIGEIRRQGMASDDEGFGHHWRRIIEGRQKGKWPLSAECVRALFDVIDLAPVTASSVRKTFTSRLDLWGNPLLDEATSSDDFDLRDLRRKPMSIYVAVNPDDLHRMRPILSLFFQQCIGLQTHSLPEHDPSLKYQVAMILNEFTALGRIPIVSDAMAYLPGYNVRILLVIQALSQLRDVYGLQGAETMQKSVAARIIFAPKEYSDAKEISDDLGFQTVRVRSHSRPPALALNKDRSRSQSVTVSEHARALLLAQEVKEIGIRAALIFLENVRPIRCAKIRYFEDRNFRRRLLPPPARPTRIKPAVVAETNTEALYVAPPLGDGFEPEETNFRLREATADDIAHLNELTRDDLSDAVKNFKPLHDRPDPTDEEIAVDVDRFMEAIRQ